MGLARPIAFNPNSKAGHIAPYWRGDLAADGPCGVSILQKRIEFCQLGPREQKDA